MVCFIFINTWVDSYCNWGSWYCTVNAICTCEKKNKDFSCTCICFYGCWMLTVIVYEIKHSWPKHPGKNTLEPRILGRNRVETLELLYSPGLHWSNLVLVARSMSAYNCSGLVSVTEIFCFVSDGKPFIFMLLLSPLLTQGNLMRWRSVFGMRYFIW